MSGFIPNGLLDNSNIESSWVGKVIDQNRLSEVEARAEDLLGVIKLKSKSEARRNAIASYIKNLIMTQVPCQVFTFGSLPLKTYLPEGDIDLTAFGNNQILDENFIPQILHILQTQEKNEHAEFKVKEVQYIQAEVKIIKCLVENFVVDISFNMLSGLCALCFFEEIDSLVGESHLFKRSIILIKAWCFYESRILGSNRGLISTYGLEILVLYVFNLYNNKFAGPFEVLYRFLEFYSKFDWDKYCISLKGPVLIGSLPYMIAVPPRRDCGDLLLSKWFLDACQYCYDSTPCSQKYIGQQFVSKHMNIIDPLRENNNLGRSINKGNFLRVKNAIAFGAKQLVRFLDCSEDNLIAEFDFFFKNTWARHGNGYWIRVSLYNLYFRNNKVQKSKQMGGLSGVSQSQSSRTGDSTVNSDREHKSTIENALKGKDESLACSSNASHRFASVYSSSNPASSNSMGSGLRSEVNHDIKNFPEYQQCFWINKDAVRLRNASNSYWNEFDLGVKTEIGHYVGEMMGMHQEEHGFGNITESRRSSNLNGYLRALMNVNSCDVSVLPPQVLAPRYGLANSCGAVPISIPVCGSFSGRNMHYSADLVKFLELQQSPNAKRTLKIEEIIEPEAHSDNGSKMATNSGSSSGNSSCKTNSESYSAKDCVVTNEQKCLTREKGSESRPAVRISGTNLSSSPMKTSQPDDVSGQLTVSTDLCKSTIGKAKISHAQDLILTSQGNGPEKSPPVSTETKKVLVGPVSSQRAADKKSLSPFAFPFMYYSLPPSETGTTTYEDAKSSISLYSTEQHKHNSGAAYVYYVNQDETSENSVDQNSDILDGDFLSYWQNLQYGRLCQSAQLEEEEALFYPSATSAVPPLYCPSLQHPWHVIPPGSVSVVAHAGALLVPEIPSTLVPLSHEGMNQCMAFWLPRFNAGTGTFFLPEPESYFKRCFARKFNKNQNRSYGHSRERFSSHSHSQRKVEKPGNSNCNSSKRVSSHGQFHRQVEKPGGDWKYNSKERRSRLAAKPGTKESSLQGESSNSTINKVANLKKRF